MYHDEFARKPTIRESFGQNALPAVALEVGGGLWMGLAASLNETISALALQLGGLLPLFACSITILAHRCSETQNLVPRAVLSPQRSPVPIPHLPLRSASNSVRQSAHVRAESGGAGFDHSGRLG